MNENIAEKAARLRLLVTAARHDSGTLAKIPDVDWMLITADFLATLDAARPEHPPYPLPEDFAAMTDAEFWGYVERIGGADRIRAARSTRSTDPINASGDPGIPTGSHEWTANSTDGLTIGPIQHSNSMCGKDGCTCWCQACERHNWRHARSADGLREARAAMERVKASAIENGGRLTPGAILDVQTAINALDAARSTDERLGSDTCQAVSYWGAVCASASGHPGQHDWRAARSTDEGHHFAVGAEVPSGVCPMCQEIVHDADCSLVGDGRPVEGAPAGA